MNQARNLVQMDTAPSKRRKWKVRFLIFAPMFALGSMTAVSGLFGGLAGNPSSGAEARFAFGLLFGLVGFVGMIASMIGHWLAEP